MNCGRSGHHHKTVPYGGVAFTVLHARSVGPSDFAILGRDSHTVHLWIDGAGASGAHSEAVFTLRRN